jgi:hypothetical protein
VSSYKTILLADVVEDLTVYPRHDINSSNVTQLADALRAGAQLPPPILEKDSLRIVDGVHRIRAYLKVLGDEGKVRVELREYADDTELFEDAARLNRQHGQKLQSRDVTKVALRLHEADRDVEQIAMVLSVPPSKIEKILGRVVVVGGEGDEHSEPVKPAWWPKPGEGAQRFTPAQAAVAESASGWRTEQTVRQLIKELRVGLHAHAPASTWELFRELAVVIGEFDPGE